MTLFAEQLKKIRQGKNISQEDLAEQLFISRQAISKWENGDTTPDLDNLVKLSEILGVSLDEMILNKPVEARIERVIENKQIDVKRTVTTFWLIFCNVLAAIFILLVFYGLLNMMGLTNFFQ